MKISKYDILIIILIIFIILTLLFTLYSRNELKQKQGFIELYFEDQNSLPEIIEINKPFNVSITIKNNELYLVNYIFEINSEISNYTRDINLSSGESTTIDLEIIPENIGWEIYFKEKRIIKEVLNTIENSKIATPRVFSFFIGDSLYQYSLPLSHYIEGLGYVFHTNLTLEELEEEPFRKFHEYNKTSTNTASSKKQEVILYVENNKIYINSNLEDITYKSVKEPFVVKLYSLNSNKASIKNIYFWYEII
jgi:hypothetical protein